MKKQTKVLVAAALLTLGASFSSMAALKNGTWVQDESGWQYIDKDGEYVEEEWCMSYGKEYWIDEDGYLGSSMWVSDDNYTYYVQSDGSKTISAWKKLYAEDDEDADEESWFYFDSKGRMVKDDYETIGDYRYYFDAEGKMLTGWVNTTKMTNTIDEDGNVVDTAVTEVVYCNEDGQRLVSSWLQTYPWDKDPEDCYEDELVWYYVKSSGLPYTTKVSDINGFDYIFGANGQMLTEWVETYTVGTTTYYTSSNALATGKTAYYCDDDYGYVKENSWKELYDPAESDTYWYHFDKTGKVFIAAATGSNAKAVDFDNGEDNTFTKSAAVIVNELKINGVVYYINQEGEMIDGLQEIDGELVYLEDGARQTGKVTLTDDYENDYEFYFAEKTEDGYSKYVAVSGNKNGYLYSNGQLMTSDESGLYKVVTVGTKEFIVDYKGKIQHKENKEYTLEDGKTTAKAAAFVTTDGINEYAVSGSLTYGTVN